jgi:hypothetical protein
VTARLPPAVVPLLAVLAAALAGALVGRVLLDGSGAPAPPAAAVVEAAPPSHLQRELPTAVERLAEARRAGRRQLALSRGPRSQERAARSLAAVYGGASRRLAGPAEAVGQDALLGALDRASHAYELLAIAVGRGDRTAYGIARVEVAASERRLPGAFRTALDS